MHMVVVSQLLQALLPLPQHQLTCNSNKIHIAHNISVANLLHNYHSRYNYDLRQYLPCYLT